MTPRPSIPDLEAERETLQRELSLRDRLTDGQLPANLHAESVEPLAAALEQASERSGIFAGEAELAEFETDFIQRSEEGLHLVLSAEVELLTKLRDSGKEQLHRDTFGLVEGGFPLRLEGQVVAALRTGRFLDKPLSRKAIKAIATLSGAPEARVQEAAAALPVVNPAHRDRLLALFRSLRDSLEAGLANQHNQVELTHQLMQAERTRSLGALSGGVAHHFNNLLSVILGFSSFVLNREDHSKEAAEALHKITEAAQRGRRLTEEILSFSGNDLEEEAPCHVHDTLANVLSLMESELSTQTRIERKFGAAKDVVLSPPSAMHQIIFNLVTNAVDSMPGGGVLTVATSNVSLKQESGRKEHFLKLEVTDSSGLLPEGFGEEAQPGLPHPTVDRSSLRLSNVYGMVGRMDGTITVTTDPGAETRVEVLIPLSGSVEPEPEERAVRRRLAPSIIWVVDDDPIFREMCNQVLSEEGHTLVECTGGKDLQAAWKNKDELPHLIIMDFSMPEYNGLELCDWLRQHGSTVPVILVSGFSTQQPDIKKTLKLRKTYFLQKPFTSRDLTDSVTVAMGETLIGDTL